MERMMVHDGGVTAYVDLPRVGADQTVVRCFLVRVSFAGLPHYSISVPTTAVGLISIMVPGRAKPTTVIRALEG